MSVEYLVMVYKQDRDVLADRDRVGVTLRPMNTSSP